jgi:hypothetical protein
MMQSAGLPSDSWRIICNKCKGEANHICKIHEYSSRPLESDEQWAIDYGYALVVMHGLLKMTICWVLKETNTH